MNYTTSFSGFSVDSIESAKEFYAQTLCIEVEDEMGGLKLSLNGGGRVYVYRRDDHQPANFTVLNFVVGDIDSTIDMLTSKGITMERYDYLPAQQDEKGILRGIAAGIGPDIAWFKDPAGNTLAVLQES